MSGGSIVINGDADVLIAVDVQNDFCAGGALAVPGGEQVAPVISALSHRFRHVVLSQDWHPPGHLSFASNHPGRSPYDQIEAAYGPQVLWPDHCVQGTLGADFHRSLDIPHAALVLRKGMDPAIDSYSVFVENDRRTPTGLAGYLRERGLRRVFLAGLALDFCVRWSGVDARRLGFEAAVIENACRCIDLNGSAAEARQVLARAGVVLTTVEALTAP
ncbi:MAG: bifunctional nicotinamidase/pyrazinamidase [Caulobacteraceae bacterium]